MTNTDVHEKRFAAVMTNHGLVFHDTFRERLFRQRMSKGVP